MRHVLCLWAVCAAVVPAWLSAETKNWPQWRGPERNGMVTGPAWPASLAGLEQRWRVELGPSYSGPIVTDDRIFVTETKDKKTEVVTALDRATGKAIWKAEWDGAISVPFFAASNGSWIRSTPAFDGERLYVAGIRDVLVCPQASDGKVLWRMDFVSEMKAPVPSFGFVCSPLLDGDAVYVQAGASLVKLDKMTGKVLWRALKDDGGMEGSAFSSPILTDLNARRQLIVQTRQKLAGLDPASGNVLWSQEVPAFRGMNILTPTIWNGQIFTSTYGGKSFSFEPKESGGQFEVSTNWENKSKGYMSTPVVIDGHAYLHLQNQRIAPRFQNSDIAKIKHAASTFFIAGSGGPNNYTGKDMLSAHKGMNIDAEEFVAVLDDAMDALDKNSVGQREKEEVLYILYSMRRDIIRV